MKKIILGLGIFFSLISSVFSQEFSYGLKGGVNYSIGGQITGNTSNGAFWGGTVEGESEIGYHGGVFAQVNFGKFFIRPEAVYTSLETTFEFPDKPSSFSVDKFDVPILIGYNIIGPLDIYAGPVYSNILDSTLEGNELDGPGAQNTNFHGQIGAKIEFGRFGIDIRYEKNLSSKVVQDLDIINAEYGVNKAFFDDAYLDQVIVSVIFKIGGPGLNERRRRACY